MTKKVLVKLFGWVLRRIIGVRSAISTAEWWYCRRSHYSGRSVPASRSMMRFQIINYHRVLPLQDPLSIDIIELNQFERQIKVLAQNFRVITLPQLMDEIHTGTLQSDTLCITMDDGYRDNYMYAYPILQKYGVPATIFLASGVIGKPGLLWHDRVLQIVRAAKVARVVWPLNGRADWNFSRGAERVGFALSLLSSLKRLPPVLRDQEIDCLLSICGLNPEELPNNEMLSWDEVREMHRHGMAFGSHTVNHPILALLSDEEIAFELSESKRHIEEQIDTTIDSFAYPNGRLEDFNPRVQYLLQHHGYRCAVTTVWGMNSRCDDPFAWKRTPAWETDIDRFTAHLVTLRMA